MKTTRHLRVFILLLLVFQAGRAVAQTSSPQKSPPRANTVHLTNIFVVFCFWGNWPPQGGLPCALPPWNHPPSRRLLTTKIENYCSWRSVAVRSTNTSASLRQCIRHCSARLPRAGISITPFGGGSRFV